MADIRVPPVGESITEVTIGKWLKAEGSYVQAEEPLVLLETDKVNVEVPAPVAGVLKKILKGDNATAGIDEIIGEIDASAQPVAAPPSKAAAPAAPAATAPAPAVTPPARAAAPASETRVMPAAARAMAESNIAPGQVTPTGPGGRMLKEDVQRAASTPAARPAPAPVGTADKSGLEEIVPMSPLRRRVAERLLQAQQTAAILTTFNEIDMSAVMSVRKRYQEKFVKKYGVKLGLMSFFIKAAVDGLKAFPEINAEIRGTDIVYRNHYDIGVAVGGERGLVVPILRRAELLSFAELELAIADFGTRANNGKLKLEELQNGTFTISNGGVYGSLMSTPILNPPQSGILGMHSIIDRPVGVDGKIELRPMMYVALSYDHRIVDGRGAVSFLKRVKECVEDCERMLLEI